jgi:NAD-reducing hydrogenase large subunit
MPTIRTISPVSRIEGHAKITIQLDDHGDVQDARFHVNEFRGFEKFAEGRLLWEMPGITARICGICPASHLVTSAKAGDEILAVEIPETADKLRRLLTLAQWMQSHALSFFHLSAPDFLLGFDSDPAKRNVFGLMEHDKELVKRGIRLRKFGQEIIEIVGGRKIHTPGMVPGGVRDPLESAKRDYLLGWIPEARETVQIALTTLKRVHEQYKHEIPEFGNFRSLLVGLVSKDGGLEYYDGLLRIKDGNDNTIADALDPRSFFDYFGEAAEPWTWLKFPYYKPFGYPNGMYRVGPLARVNICDYIETPLAEAERRVFKAMSGNVGVVNNSFCYHYARLIELMFTVEKAEMLLSDPAIIGTNIRAEASINKEEGIGSSEAPRGTLFHHYWVHRDGSIKKANLLIATAQNNLAMNRTVRQIATHFIDGRKGTIAEGILNRVEAGIRCYDPCLSCSTHALGRMPMHIELMNADGEIVRTLRR